ncbi:MAG: hypothetical protein FJX76_03070 [Armatimonadetes bacterium]|nr:hypothetical protein [Armatimonadota bacterium]
MRGLFAAVQRLWKRDCAPRELALVCEERDQRRSCRFVDGTDTVLRTAHGDRVDGRLLDVASEGVRLWADAVMSVGARVSCLLHFEGRAVPAYVRLQWRRQTESGFEYGASYAPVVPGTAPLLDNYLYQVLNRGALAA